MCMCHYYSSLLLFAKTERMLSASYLFIFSLFVYLNPSINCPHVDRLTGDDEPPTLRGDPLPSPPTHPTPPTFPPKMACTVLSLSPSPPFGPIKKGKWGFYSVISRHVVGPDEIFFSMFVPPAQSGVSL